MVSYKNLTVSERSFLKARHECLTKIPSVELVDLLKNPRLLPSTPGVYIMWRKSNDHIYVGESVNVSRRLIEHATQQYPKQYIDREIKKLGPSHFRVGFLKRVDDQAARRRMEGHYVSLFNSYRNGYNGSKDGNPMSAWDRLVRKWVRKFMNAIAPKYMKRRRRRLAFSGTAALKRFSRQLSRK